VEVIDLSVIDDTYLTILVEERLIPRCEVNDGEMPVAEAYAWRDMDPLSIRAPVSEDVRHAPK
jgi:hypothetical protein